MESKERKFFDKPLDNVALEYHPERVSLDDFVEDIIDSVKAFAENIKYLAEASPDFLDNSYPEEWMEAFLAWYELNRVVK